MINKIGFLSIGLLLSGLIASHSVMARDFYRPYTPYNANAFIGKELLLNAKGLAVAYSCPIPETVLGTTTALCFNVPLFNMKTGAYVGTLVDRLADIIPKEGGGLLVTVTSTFQFTEWKKKPQLTTRVLGNVQPFIEGSTTMTHLTGAIPSGGDNDILFGTKRFRHATGTARESGAINLSEFQGQVGDEVIFDLIWNIKLD